MGLLKSFLILTTITGTLAACTDEGSKSPAAPPVFTLSNVNAMAAPANSAPDYFTQQVLQAFGKMGVDQPMSDTVFSPAVLGNRDREAQQDYRKALARLSLRGNAILRDIQSRCSISYKKDSSGNSVNTTGDKTTTLQQSVSGYQCPMSQQSNTVFSDQVVSQTETEFKTTGTLSASFKYEIPLRGNVGFRAISYRAEGRTDLQITTTGQQNLTKYKTFSQGPINITLHTGEVLTGTLYTEQLEVYERHPSGRGGKREISTQKQSVYDLNSSTGAIRIVLIEDSSVANPRVAYVNGREIHPSQINFSF